MVSLDIQFKQRAVIEFLVAENVKSVNDFVDICSWSMVNKTLDISFVHHWVLRIKGSEVEKAIYFRSGLMWPLVAVPQYK